ncbi:hypothetical protein G2W53_040059 [Senna tora]|uniref:Uncharacterized protein n=1 Tax=Senna tora TaxID=362788 RepID=A0A834SRK9_9FABA|nr:hypothetical protein G2W53_040059 [Senna tora]
METARPFEMLSIREVFASSDDHSPVTTPILPFLKGEALERVIILGDSREGSDEVMPIQKATQSSGVQLCEYWWRADVNGCPLEVHALRCSIISTGCLHLLVCLCAHGMWFVLVVLVVVTVALVMQRSSRHYTGEGCGRRNMSKEDCYLVDPASSHMLVSKIKPCMSRSWTLGWVDRSASGVHRSARPFCRRCAPGLNWPGRASGAVTLKKLECSKQAYALDTLAWDNIIGF